LTSRALFPYTTLFRSRCVFLWDCRPDASAAIIEAVADQEGTVGESHAIDMQGGTIIGILMTPHPIEGMGLEDFAGSLRLRYAIADRKSTRLNSSHVKI